MSEVKLGRPPIATPGSFRRLYVATGEQHAELKRLLDKLRAEPDRVKLPEPQIGMSVWHIERDAKGTITEEADGYMIVEFLDGRKGRRLKSSFWEAFSLSRVRSAETQ